MNKKNISIIMTGLLVITLLGYQVYRIRQRRLHEQCEILTLSHDTDCDCCHH